MSNHDFDPDDPFLPDVLDFQFPVEKLRTLRCRSLVTLHLLDDELLYRQLVCWCLIQRYRYYVLSPPQPKASDLLYDFIESRIKQMEDGCSYLTNSYSPSRKVGSSRAEDYPPFIRWLFREEVNT